MQSAFYSHRRPWLFIALAPGVLGTVLILVPFAFMGLVLIAPGLCGFLGLVGLTMAWFGLMWPRIVSRRGGLVLALLACSLPAPLSGLSLLRANTAYQQHAIDWMRGAGYASANFLLLALFLGVMLLVPRHPTQDASWRYNSLARIAGMVVAVAALIVPAGYVLAFAGYGKYIRVQQGEEARSLASVALRAVRHYQDLHQGELPVDNRSAGLPPPEGLQSRYVQSVRIAQGKVTLTYRNDPVVVLFGASTYGVVLSFTRAEEPGNYVLEEAGGFWSCRATGYQLEGDTPLFLDSLCDTRDLPTGL
ncbi:hypothetical protein [Dyella choica]|uniref:Uncharacterized protein n=1 Tax=Dyella choica TaxID=1927959 RepID=A0A3S0S1F7_9GAMM|nr:hypothetical protein [Dyella choica]RUL77578.1 hypothetical protein EKH80_06780 [Dyella choica]